VQLINKNLAMNNFDQKDNQEDKINNSPITDSVVNSDNEDENNNNSKPDLENPDSQNEKNQQINNELNIKISDLQQKNNELNDKLLRSFAEIENIRRRSKEEVEKSSKFAITNFANDLVVVVENFFLASNNAPALENIDNLPFKTFVEAMLMTQKELVKSLEKNQLFRIFPLNQQFDHNLHEAISQVVSDEDEGKIINVIQAGYRIGDRLIRPALVVVAKKAE
jgi:molecular chaperone GrpE